ncbi:MAG: ABC transporter ATP-binding protein [Candidatus Methanomethylophilaceae archaeon]
MNDDDYAIRVENLTRTFRSTRGTEKTAVDDISFDVKRGEIFGVLGPNGAGKTTTIKMLSTLLLPTSGKAFVLGMDVSLRKNERNLRMRINVVSGGERGLYYRLTGKQNLQYFADLYGITKREQTSLIDELLDLVGLSEAADVRVENYSRGMKQRIHIARALINRPEVLYLDEPTIGLDPEISRGIRALVRRLADNGTTIILTTHYMFEAEELCDRMVILSKGRIVGYGTAPELKNSVSDAEMIRVVTGKDPYQIVSSVEHMDGVIGVRTEMVAGRYETSIHTEKGKDVLNNVEEKFRDTDIRSIGYDEPTLEDTYLHLTGGE